MTSTALKYKSNFSAAFRKNFKQRIAGLIAFLVASIAVPAFSLIANYSYVFTTKSAGKKIDATDDLMLVLAAMTAICGFFSLIIAPEMFREIYKKQACDHYFAVPVKREEIFCANFLYGILANTTAFIASAAVFIGAVYAMSNEYIQITVNFDRYFLSAAAMLAAVLAIYSAFVMCAVTAGKRLHYIIMSIICLICTSVAVSGVIVNLNKIWGFYVSSLFPSSISPVENAIGSFVLTSDEKNTILGFILISVTEIIGMFAAGYAVFKTRKAEAAEVTVSGKIIPYVIMALLLTASYMNAGTYRSAAVSVIAGIAFSVIAAMLFSAVFFKKVFTKQTGIATVCVCVACTVITAGTALPIYSGYINNIPDKNKIDRIEFTDIKLGDFYLNTVNVLNGGMYSLSETDCFEIKSEQGIEKTLALHKKLIDNKTIELSNKSANVSIMDYLIGTNEPQSEYSNLDCRITYYLKTGGKITRTYSANSSLLINEFADLMKTEEMTNQLKPFAIADGDVLYATVSGDYDNNSQAFAINNPYESEKYPEAYTYDIPAEEFVYQAISLDDFSLEEFNKAYRADIDNTDNTEYLVDLYTNNNIGMYPYMYSGEYQALGITIYSISPDADSASRNKLKGMTAEEIQNFNDNYYMSETISEENVKLFNSIEAFHVTVKSSDKHMINYIGTMSVAII